MSPGNSATAISVYTVLSPILFDVKLVLCLPAQTVRIAKPSAIDFTFAVDFGFYMKRREFFFVKFFCTRTLLNSLS